MKVTFTRTGGRRYGVSVELPNGAIASMNPAPGYQDRLPHDAAHFIVENELGILGGVFGQLASGGNSSTFQTDDTRKIRKARKFGAEMAKANKHDALFSEHVIYAAQSRWEKHDIIPDKNIPAADLERVIAKFEEFAAEWSRLPVGGSIVREWRHGRSAKRRR